MANETRRGDEDEARGRRARRKRRPFTPSGKQSAFATGRQLRHRAKMESEKGRECARARESEVKKAPLASLSLPLFFCSRALCRLRSAVASMPSFPLLARFPLSTTVSFRAACCCVSFLRLCCVLYPLSISPLLSCAGVAGSLPVFRRASPVRYSLSSLPFVVALFSTRSLISHSLSYRTLSFNSLAPHPSRRWDELRPVLPLLDAQHAQHRQGAPLLCHCATERERGRERGKKTRKKRKATRQMGERESLRPFPSTLPAVPRQTANSVRLWAAASRGLLRMAEGRFLRRCWSRSLWPRSFVP